VILEHVAGQHRFAEFGLVDGEEIDRRRAARPCERMQMRLRSAPCLIMVTPGNTGFSGKCPRTAARLRSRS
jgi:hypothetical protein